MTATGARAIEPEVLGATIARFEQDLAIPPTLSGIDYSEVPEEYRPVFYGQHQIQPRRLGSLILLSQVRDGLNPEIENLADSIGGGHGERPNLINIPDIAFLEEEPFDSYVRFTNRTWGSNHRIDDFEPDTDGMFNLVVAGHSRDIAMMWKATERSKAAKAAGYMTDPADTLVNCKIHPVTDPLEIFQIQMGENIHSIPSEERRAMGMVELYRYGLEQGQWTSKAGFLEQVQGKYTRTELDRAVRFQELPENLRGLVLSGRYKFGVAIEVSRLRAPYEDFLHGRNFNDDPELIAQHEDEIQEQVHQELMIRLEKAVSNKWTIKDARNAVNGSLANWKATLKSIRDQDARELDLTLFDPNADWHAIQKKQRRRHTLLVASLSHSAINSTAAVLRSNVHVSNDADQRTATEGVVVDALQLTQTRLSEIVGNETADEGEAQPGLSL